MYRERASRIDGAFVWTINVGSGTTRVLPDGCMDLIWGGGRVLIAGPDTRATMASAGTEGELTGLRFAPGFAPSVLGAPASEFTDRRVYLDEVWSRREIGGLIQDLHQDRHPGRVLESLSERRYPRPADPSLTFIVQAARRGDRAASIADALGLSDRQLQRRCVASFGYGVKRLTRILRMQQALELSRAGVGLAEAAARAGYADQAHMSRDVTDLGGLPPAQLLAEGGSAANRSTELPSGSRTTA
ncbi:MAG: putative AraC family transcriptional regulator [Acidimicrobiia bacterium]|nr:putative AraC family transcriptional regulator [Acidimicrobiia bacterium]